MTQYTVYLAGAGPGDPELITLKVINLLKRADCILYDSLLNKEILKYTPTSCKKIHVGKRFGKHYKTQDEINYLLLTSAQKYKTVVRLKGGDPLIFGRAGEELDFLHKHSINTEIIPGITTASSVASSLRISLTHRLYGQSIIFLSGYAKNKQHSMDSLPNYDWQFLAQTPLSIVIYMGLYNLPKICQKLLVNGKDKNTPIAIISKSSYQNQQFMITELNKVSENFLKEHPEITFPALIIIGEIVGTSPLYKQNLT